MMCDEIQPEPETVEEALRLIELKPDDPLLYQQLGGIYVRAGDFSKAWTAYMDALKLDPNDPFTCLYFGNLLTICDDKKYAMQLYRHAAKNAPKLSAVHWCIAGLHRSLGQFADADMAYQRAVEVDPADLQAREKLAEWRRFLAERAESLVVSAEP